jgi:hypothetical protein
MSDERCSYADRDDRACRYRLLISAYLTYIHYADIQPFCTGISRCERVQTSDWSRLAGAPVALVGLVGYAGRLGGLRVPGEPGRLGTALSRSAPTSPA